MTMRESKCENFSCRIFVPTNMTAFCLNGYKFCERSRRYLKFSGLLSLKVDHVVSPSASVTVDPH